jgi:hypothetical protein
MRIATTLSFLLATLISGAPTAYQSLDFSDYGIKLRAADPSLTGYLGAFFLGDKPSVYFYLSNGNDAVSFKALNRGQPVINPTKGTQGVRDPAIVAGGGAEAGKKWYIIGTDLHISKVNLLKRSEEKLLELTLTTDVMGRSSTSRVAWHLRLGEYRPGQLDQRASGPSGGRDSRHGLGTRGNLGCREVAIPGSLGLQVLSDVRSASYRFPLCHPNPICIH